MKPDKTCSCGAPIKFVHGGGGKTIPLNLDSEERRYYRNEDRNQWEHNLTYVNHFADCPDRDKHRKEKK